MSHSIATRTGDDGTTSLLYGQRVPKDHAQVEAVGTFDELNVAIGAVRPLLNNEPTEALLLGIQKNLVALMGELACAESDVARYESSTFPKVGVSDVTVLDDAVARLESLGLKFDGWATPGLNPVSAAFDAARVAARRGERRLVGLKSSRRNIRPELLQFVNRLSDLLWLLAREAEKAP